MKSLLIITALDCEQEANQRIHHVMRHIGNRFDEVTVMHFAQYNQKSLASWVRESFFFSVQEYRMEKIRHLRINPVGNIPYAFGKGLLRFPDNQDQAVGIFRKFLLNTMNFLGVFKSFSTTFCYFFVYFLKLRNKSYDIVLVEGPWEGLLGVFLKARKAAKTLVYQDFDYFPGSMTNKIRRILTEKIELFCMAKADLRISSGKMLQELRQRKLKQTVVFIPNGIDYRYWRKAQTKISHHTTLIYMGNVIDWTGLHWTLAALPQIRETIPDIRLVIIGQGHPRYLKKLMGLVERLQIKECVEFTGFVPYPDLPVYLQKADIGIATFEPIPLLKYAFPLKVIEYMSACLPVIASRGSESARLIEAFDCGLTVHYGNFEELKEAIHCLMSDNERYRTCAENSKKLSRQFDWEDLMAVQYRHIRQAFGGRVEE